MTWTETHHANAEELAAALAGQVAAQCRQALAARGRAVLALAGGQTPLPIYRRLAAADLDWSKVTVLPSDERWVAHEDAACNLHRLRTALAAARGLHLLPLTPAMPAPHVTAALALATLAALPEPFDLALLGMGGDGHFASLFPGAPELAAGLDLRDPDDALVVHPDPLPPEAPYPRISLSAARLLRSERLLLAIQGPAKRAVLERAARHNDPFTLPICALLHHPSVRVEIHWSP